MYAKSGTQFHCYTLFLRIGLSHQRDQDIHFIRGTLTVFTPNSSWPPHWSFCGSSGQVDRLKWPISQITCLSSNSRRRSLSSQSPSFGLLFQSGDSLSGSSGRILFVLRVRAVDHIRYNHEPFTSCSKTLFAMLYLPRDW